jgi:hypothetical protein
MFSRCAPTVLGDRQSSAAIAATGQGCVSADRRAGTEPRNPRRRARPDQIEQSDVRIFSREQAERFNCGPGFAAHLETGGLLKHRPHPHAHDGVMVDDQDARHLPLMTTGSDRAEAAITNSPAARLPIAALQNRGSTCIRKLQPISLPILNLRGFPTEISTPEGCTTR